MSLKQHTDASLAGFGQPIFPPACEKINGLLSEKGGLFLNEQDFHRIGCAVPNYIPEGNMTKATTSDEYTWFRQLSFQNLDRRICVLLPWAQDWEKEADNSRLDRSIAVYVRGASDQDVEITMAKLITALKEEISRQEEEMKKRLHPPLTKQIKHSPH